MNKVQGADGCQLSQLIFAEFRHAITQVVNAGELTRDSFAHNRLTRLFAQTSHIPQTETTKDAAVFILLERTQPIGTGNVDRQDLQSMTLRICNDPEGLLKTHRLVVENRRRERREVITFQSR